MDRILRTSVVKKTMDNITVVFVAFKNFDKCVKGEAVLYSQNLKLNEIKHHHYVVNEELMEEEDFPNKPLSDYCYIQGQCETPRHLRPKPKGFISTFQAPTIITSNPEELAMDMPQNQFQANQPYTNQQMNLRYFLFFKSYLLSF